MKQILLLLTIAILAMPTSAQKRRTTTKTRSAAPTVTITKGEVKHYGDWLDTQIITAKRGKSDIKVEVPIDGRKELVDSIQAWIVKSISEKYKGSDIEGAMRAMLNSLEKVEMMSGKKEYETLNEEYNVIYSSAHAVTYKCSGYLYTGGAHGMPWDLGTTFRVPDGLRFNYSMLPAFADVRSFVVLGLAKSMEVTASELTDYVNLSELHYPGTLPYITSEGINFQYGAYEIGPYSIGMPCSVVPLGAIRSKLSKSALSYF